MKSMEALKRFNLPFFLLVILICAVVSLLVLKDIYTIANKSNYTEQLSSEDLDFSNEENIEEEEEAAPSSSPNQLIEFNQGSQNRCDVMNGKWVFNRSLETQYTDASCPYLDKQVSCVLNGRPDGDYLHWQWEMDDCYLSRFDGADALEKLRGKRLMFVGDSLQREQWQSFVCLVQYHVPPKLKSMKHGRSLSVFTAEEYNTSIEFYNAPFLIESNSDVFIIKDLRKRILRLDSISKHARHWMGVDILVFNTYVWWTTGFKLKTTWKSMKNNDGYEEMSVDVAYKLGLETWANWIDSNINPNKTRVFFTTISPTHIRSSEWNFNDRDVGNRCYNETQPVMEKGYIGFGTDKRIMRVVEDVVGRMKKVVSILNITQMSEYRKDGHASVYTEYGGKRKQKSDPKYADCIHWCLPGLPDVWNQLLYSFL